MLEDTAVGKDFFTRSQKHRKKSQNKWYYIKLYAMHSKGNNQQEETTTECEARGLIKD
jgi:hypothetical protein